MTRFTSGAGHGRVGWIPRVAPLDRLRSVQADPVGEALRDVEVATGYGRPPIDDLREHLVPAEEDVDLDAARQRRVRDALQLQGKRVAARGSPVAGRRTVRGGVRRVGRTDCAGDRRMPAPRPAREREGCDRDDQRDRRQPNRALDGGRTHEEYAASSASPNDSRTIPSKSDGRTPSALANSRRYMRR